MSIKFTLSEVNFLHTALVKYQRYLNGVTDLPRDWVDNVQEMQQRLQDYLLAISNTNIRNVEFTLTSDAPIVYPAKEEELPEPPEQPEVNILKYCKVEGCEKRATARGMCGKHYQRWYTSTRYKRGGRT